MNSSSFLVLKALRARIIFKGGWKAVSVYGRVVITGGPRDKLV